MLIVADQGCCAPEVLTTYDAALLLTCLNNNTLDINRGCCYWYQIVADLMSG